MRTAICAAIIKDGKLLLVRKKQTWILPGGKPNPKERDLECLFREIGKEELPRTKLCNIKHYKDFEGQTPHTGDILKAKVYFSEINGRLYPPAREISKSEWVNDFSKYNLSDITTKIVNSLRQDKYL